MVYYNLYFIDVDGHITGRLDFCGEDDDAAIAHVQQHHCASECEIWQSGRIVAKVPRIGPVERFETWVRAD